MTTDTDPPRRDGAGDALGDYDDFLGDPAALVRSRVRRAATLLRCGAAGGMLLYTVVTLEGLAFLWVSFTDPALAQTEMRPVGFGFTGAGLVGLAFFAVMRKGVRHLRDMDHLRWAKAAAVMGVCSVLVLSLFGLLIVPAAVWTLILLRDPAVKSQFRSTQPTVPDNDA